MIIVNGKKIDIKHFPDGTQMLLDADLDDVFNSPMSHAVMLFTIRWIYENDEELATIMYLTRHYHEKIPVPYLSKVRFRLVMDYLPNARMDRTKNLKEVFTLKYFCEFINSLKFDEVEVLDPHSNVGTALLNNLTVKSPEFYIKTVLDDIEGVDIDGGKAYGGTTVIYFPDEGAMKRYGDLKVFGNRTFIYGSKTREWETGKILGITIKDRNGNEIKGSSKTIPLRGVVVLMIDDIISYGGTLAYSADKLKALGALAIYAYASHTENSVLDEEKGTLLKRLKDRTVDELFTTDSLYSGNCEFIEVIKNKDEYDTNS